MNKNIIILKVTIIQIINIKNSIVVKKHVKITKLSSQFLENIKYRFLLYISLFI